jgi:hypothetical protein
MTNSAVRMTGVVKRFPGVVANDGVNFEVRKGKFTLCSVRTGPASRRSRTSSPAFIVPTRERSS